MQRARDWAFGTTALALGTVTLVWGWSAVQAPGAGGTGFALARAAVLLLAAAHALHQCWLSAADWIVPAGRRPWGWMRTEFALMVAVAALSAAVTGVCVGALVHEPTIALGVALCTALALAFCAFAYACGRIGLLLRKRCKRRRFHVWHASRGMRAPAAPH